LNPIGVGTLDELVSVVIVSWNGRRLLARCLPKVLTQTYTPLEVIVVDNGSQDGSADWVEEQFPSVKLVRSARNLGFAAGTNLGIEVSSGTFIATLNNDAFASRTWLEELVRAMGQDEQIGMCSSQMLFADRPYIINSAGIVVDRVGIAWDRLGGQTADGHTEVRPVFGACAGAALYRRAMLDDVGLFDEDFFTYLEDVDLAWRAQWAGWKCVYVPQAIVYHAHSSTAKEGSHFKNRLLGRNKLWTLCKNYPFPHLLWYAPLIVAYDLMSVTYGIATGRGHGVVQGRIEALSKVPHTLAKRQQIVRRVSSRTMMAKLHPLENPLAILRRYVHIRIAKGR